MKSDKTLLAAKNYFSVMIDYNIRDANATSTNFNSPENVVNRNLNESPSYINLSEDSDFCGFVYNPDDPDTYFEIWMGCLLTAVGILGIIGNIVSMIILSRPQMRSSINYLLIGLARYDTVLIITSILLYGLPTIYPYSGYLSYYYFIIYPKISPVTFPIAMIVQTASVYMTFIVTLERYIAVCHPLKARAMCTYGRAKLYFIGCLIFSTLYNIPRFWEVINRAHEIHQYPGLKEKIFTNEDVIYCIEPSEIRIDQTYINIYIHWCYLIVIYFIPFLNLAILNCLIYRQIKRANRERQRLSRSEQREISLATMLICVVIVFFLFNFLAFYLNILEAFYRQIRTNLTKISNLLVTINSSANFIIYVIFGEKFKRICLQLFCKRKYNRDAPDLIHYESSISNGGGDGGTNRMSRKFSRHGTTRSTIVNFRTGNGVSAGSGEFQTTTIPSKKKITRTRAPSPSPCVYYPARDIKRTTSINSSLIMSTHSLNGDWDNNGKNALVTSSDF